jgi:hypothetical protein
MTFGREERVKGPGMSPFRRLPGRTEIRAVSTRTKPVQPRECRCEHSFAQAPVQRGLTTLARHREVTAFNEDVSAPLQGHAHL